MKEILLKILSHIPGFRSKVKWKMIIASVYYLFCFLSLTEGLYMFLAMAAEPFFIFGIVDIIKILKSMKSKKADRNKSRIDLCKFAVSIVVLIIAITMTPAAQNAIKSISAVKKPAVSTSISDGTKKVNKPVQNNDSENKPGAVSGNLKVSYIDVGQGDSILIQQGSQSMLIDTGTNQSTSSLLSYLKSQNIKKLNYLILTHPHEDHIGGADAVIKNFDVENVYMTKYTTNTKTYRDVIAAMKSKGLKATCPKESKFKLGSADCIAFAPVGADSKDLNTTSIMVKITFGNTKFLFTGDAQKSNEQAMISKGYDLSADVLKVGHHGSHTSTSEEFLNKVNPKYAVISCGKGNDYGHPHKETMETLKSKNIPVYRTDESGTIVCTSDGKSIKFNVNAGDYRYSSEKSSSSSKTSTTAASSETATSAGSTSSAATTSQKDADKNRIVYWTKDGKSYHYDRNCKALKRSKNVLSGPLKDCPKSDPCDFCVH